MHEVDSPPPPVAAFLTGDCLASGAAKAARALLGVFGCRRVEIYQVAETSGKEALERLAEAFEVGPDSAAEVGVALAREAMARSTVVHAGDRAAIALSSSGQTLGALIVSPVPDEDLLQREAQLVALGLEAARRFDQASELDRMKSEFVSIVSHELRTPLTTIKGCLDGIHRGYAANPDTLNRMLLMARQNADRLGRLIDDLLDLSRLKTQLLVLRSVPVQVREILEEVAACKAPMAEQQGVHLAVSTPVVLPWVLGDADRLFQSVANLTDNAIKFCGPGDAVRLEAHAHGTHCTIRVVDTGPGIDPAEHAAIFEKFRQLDSSASRKAGGVGLGLFITREIVEAMGGGIRVESARGAGTTFEIRLPIAASEVEGGPTTGDILLIDDDLAFAGYVKLVLSRAGYRVHSAGDPLKGIEMARTLQPGLILLDLMMPGLDGWTVIERLEEDPGTRAIPAVILSTLRPDPGAHRFRSYRYLEKSGDPKQLVQAIRELVRAAGPHQTMPAEVAAAEVEALAGGLPPEGLQQPEPGEDTTAASREGGP